MKIFYPLPPNSFSNKLYVCIRNVILNELDIIARKTKIFCFSSTQWKQLFFLSPAYPFVSHFNLERISLE